MAKNDPPKKVTKDGRLGGGSNCSMVIVSVSGDKKNLEMDSGEGNITL